MHLGLLRARLASVRHVLRRSCADVAKKQQADKSKSATKCCEGLVLLLLQLLLQLHCLLKMWLDCREKRSIPI